MTRRANTAAGRCFEVPWRAVFSGSRNKAAGGWRAPRFLLLLAVFGRDGVFAGVALFLAMGLAGATRGACGATLAGLAAL